MLDDTLANNRKSTNTFGMSAVGQVLLAYEGAGMKAVPFVELDVDTRNIAGSYFEQKLEMLAAKTKSYVHFTRCIRPIGDC